MKIREAVRCAKARVADLFEDEGITAIALEEIECQPDEGVWTLTIGFFRPWHKGAEELTILGEPRLSRCFKVVRLADATGEVLSVRNWAQAEVAR